MKPYETVAVLARCANDRPIDDILEPSWVDTYYARRPDDLENLSLFEFMKWFDKQKDKPKEDNRVVHKFEEFDSYLVKRQYPYIVNHFKFNQNESPNEYYHSLLLLHHPWRDSTELLGSFPSYEDAFQFYIAENADCEVLKYHEKLQKFQKS